MSLVFKIRRKLWHPKSFGGLRNTRQSREPTNSADLRRRVQESNPGHIDGRRALAPCITKIAVHLFTQNYQLFIALFSLCFVHPCVYQRPKFIFKTHQLFIFDLHFQQFVSTFFKIQAKLKTKKRMKKKKGINYRINAKLIYGTLSDIQLL